MFSLNIKYGLPSMFNYVIPKTNMFNYFNLIRSIYLLYS